MKLRSNPEESRKECHKESQAEFLEGNFEETRPISRVVFLGISLRNSGRSPRESS